MNIWKDWKAELESAYSLMLEYSKITVCAICKTVNSIKGSQKNAFFENFRPVVNNQTSL